MKFETIIDNFVKEIKSDKRLVDTYSKYNIYYTVRTNEINEDDKEAHIIIKDVSKNGSGLSVKIVYCLKYINENKMDTEVLHKELINKLVEVIKPIPLKEKNKEFPI